MLTNINNFNQGLNQLVDDGIYKKIFPWCSIAIGNIYEEYIYNFGYKDYQNKDKINSNIYYDVSSLTKVMVCIPAVCILEDMGLLNFDDLVIKHIPNFAINNKSDITIMNLIMHTSWLTKVSWFSKDTTKIEFLDLVINLPKEYETWSDIYYSDMWYILLGYIVEIITWISLDDFIKTEFFDKLWITAKFGPIDIENCSATTDNDFWFNSPTRWFVNDKKAFLMNHVSGFAWLFANISDISKFAKFILSDGQKIISNKNINLIKTQYQNTNRTLWRTLNQNAEVMTKQSFTQYSIDQHKWLTSDTNLITLMWSSLSENTIFHTWFTWCVLAIDLDKSIYISILSNRTYQMIDASIFTKVFRKNLFELISKHIP